MICRIRFISPNLKIYFPFVGLTGPKGDQGRPGAPGLDGSPGRMGFDGAPGPKGFSQKGNFYIHKIR